MGTQVEGAAGQQAAATVVQAAGLHAELLGGVDQSLLVIVQGTADAHPGIAAAGQGAIGIGQAGGPDVEVGGGDQALEVGQCLIDAQGQRLGAEQLAAAVVEAARGQSESLLTGDFSAPVVDLAEVLQQQLAGGVDQTLAVVQVTTLEVETEAGIAEQLASLLHQAAGSNAEVLPATDTTAVIDEFARGQVQGIATGQLPLAVVETAGAELGLARGGQHALTVAQAVAGQRQCAVRQQLAAIVAQRTTTEDVHGARAGNTATAVVEAGGSKVETRFAVDQTLLVGQRFAEGNGHGLLAEQSTAAVVQTATCQVHAGLAGNQALAAVDHMLDGNTQAGPGQQPAFIAVIELLADDPDGLLAGDFAAAVIDFIDGEGKALAGADQAVAAVVEALPLQGQSALSDQQAAALVEAADARLYIRLAGDFANTVVQGAGRQVEQAAGRHGATLVVEVAGDHERGQVTAAEQPFAVVQPACAQVQPLGGNRAFDVIQGLGDAQHQRLVAEQLAAGVIQLARGQGEALLTGDFTASVDDLPQVLQQEPAGAVDQSAVGVIQLALLQVEAEVGLAEQFAAVVLIQARDLGDQALAGGDAALGAVVDLAGVQLQGTGAAEFAALAVVQRPGVYTCVALGAEDSRLAVVEAGAGQFEITVADDGAALVIDLAGADQPEVGGAGEGAALVVDPAGLERQRALTADQALAIDQFAFQPADLGRQGDDQGRGAAQSATAVVQAVGVDAGGLTAEDHPLCLVDQAIHGKGQLVAGQQLAAAVVETLTDKADARLAGQLAATVVDFANLEFQRFRAAHQAALPVVQAAGVKLE
ncbi:hypothetical protein FQZ97_441660 [compost metagenome]